MTEPEIDFNAIIRRMAKDTETAFALVLAARVEEWLQGALEGSMRELSSRHKDRLFSGYGPLSTFSAKIDVAFAFNLFGEETFNDLRAIKDIRNAFAHSVEVVHFGSPAVRPMMQRLAGWTKEAKPQ